MVSILGIIAIGTAITLFEVPSLRRKGYRKECWAFFVVLLIGMVLDIAWVLHARIPSPLVLLEIVYKPINNFLMRYLK